MITKRRLNIALVVLGVVVVIAVFIAARAAGNTTATGNATACNTYWTWYDNTQDKTPAVYTAYKDATTQPLINDLHALAEGLQGNTRVNTTNASNDIADICTSEGYADPAS